MVISIYEFAKNNNVNQKEFENVLNNRLALIRSKLADKSKQYLGYKEVV